MLVLHVENDANESVEDMIASYSEQFSIGRNIKALYYAIKDMCEYLTEVDMGAVPHKYQPIYPELILKTYGEGIVSEIVDTTIVVSFYSVGKKKLSYDVCIKNKFIEFI